MRGAREVAGSERSSRGSERGARWLRWATSARTGWVFALVPLLLGLWLAVGLGEGQRERLPTDALPRGFDSTRAVSLTEGLEQEGQSTAVVVFSVEPGAPEPELQPSQLDALTQLLATVGAVPTLVEAEDGTAALGIVPIEADSATQVGREVAQLRSTLAQAVPAGVAAQVTGPAGVEADLAEVFSGANVRLLAITASVVAVLLVVTYRSPVLWLVPLTVIGVADRAAVVLATHVLAAFDIPWNESTTGILSVLVFGAGTNYALLLISRYRDELRAHEDRRVAMRVALRRTAEPVLASAGTVVVGVLALLLSLVPTTRGLGLACAVGIVVAAFFALVCLPSAMVLFPRGIFWPRQPHVGESPVTESRSAWRRIGERVVRRPRTVGLAVVLGLGILATGSLNLPLGLDTSEQFLRKPEAIDAAERIAESFPAGTANPTTIVSRAAVADVTERAQGVPGVASVTVAAEHDGVTSLHVVLEAEEGSLEADEAVAALRDALDPLEQTYVGGPEAQRLDATQAAARDRLVIVPIILAVVMLALMLLLRAVLAPALLVVTVAGTYVASLGASWWVFRGALGFTALDEGVPLLAFLFLVALGVDYNIFLVTRAREESRAHGTRAGMIRALGATGGVITSAGILLAAVFAVLGVLPLVVLAQLGVVVCVGVLLDTLVVRTMLVPACAFVLGDHFWWPRRLPG